MQQGEMMVLANLSLILILHFFLRQECYQPWLAPFHSHKAADGHDALGQHSVVKSYEGLRAPRHGSLIRIEKCGASQLVVGLQHGCGLEPQQP